MVVEREVDVQPFVHTDFALLGSGGTEGTLSVAYSARRDEPTSVQGAPARDWPVMENDLVAFVRIGPFGDATREAEFLRALQRELTTLGAE